VKSKSKPAEDRRRARRTNIQESFQLFLVIPKVQGMVRIYLRDISKVGLCFRTEMETDFHKGQNFEARIYLNPAFYLPLNCEVIRVGGQEVAINFLDPDSGAALAISKLQDFFDEAEKSGVFLE
jgi:hypothetical protein